MSITIGSEMALNHRTGEMRPVTVLRCPRMKVTLGRVLPDRDAMRLAVALAHAEETWDAAKALDAAG